jgi:hypothetical protein
MGGCKNTHDVMFGKNIIIPRANVKSARKISSAQQILSFPQLVRQDLAVGLAGPEGSQAKIYEHNEPSPSRDLPAGRTINDRPYL